MSQLPVQPARIHCPPPRSDILSRERLNSWLERAAAGRLALIIAEAGFGKTTLLADWARHTRRLTAWYRLEPDDRDWLTFVRHLVASGRELHPGFAPDTFAMLMALGTGGPTRKEIIAAIARETAEFAAAAERGLTLVLDDYHVVDGFDETEPIVRNLLDRTGPTFSVVIASRSMPTLPIGRLRARGGVATLSGKDLRFDVAETSSLFRDAYQHPLDEDVASDLCERTEGWAALLTLAKTRIDELQDAPAVVARLNAARGELYDFLAEEVLAGLQPDLEAFLTRASVLTAVDIDRAKLIDNRTSDDAAACIREAERLGLLSRPDSASPHTFHPLVREFLAARLEAQEGAPAIRRLHRAIAESQEITDWHAAAWHYRAAGMDLETARVVDASISSILASGHFERARTFLDGSAGSIDRPGALILRSRLELERGRLAGAIDLAQRAVTKADRSDHISGLATRNLSAMHGRHGFPERSVELASEALAASLDEPERKVAEATVLVSTTQEEGDLDSVSDYLTLLALEQDALGLDRYAAVTRLNLAVILLWLGRFDDAARVAVQAEGVLAFAGASAERTAAAAVRASVGTILGNSEAVASLLLLADSATTSIGRDEASIEAARLLADYGDLESAEQALGRISIDSARGYLGAIAAVRATVAIRRGDLATAREALEGARGELHDAAGKFRIALLAARILIASGDASDRATAEARRISDAQRSPYCRSMANLLEGLATEPSSAIDQLVDADDHLLSLLAEEVTRVLDRLDLEAMGRVRRESHRRPDRWRSALRLRFEEDREAAELLCEIGGAEDAALVCSAGATTKWLRPFAAKITRRLAPRLHIGDLGQVTLKLGGESLARPMRRKVLALLCFLVTRPRLAATRDEAIDAIWPDLGPDTAGNSLHQTIYFLRRVVEPEFKEWRSAGYLAFDGDILSLDSDLVESDSRIAWRLVREAQLGDTRSLDALVELYEGSFALDFAYEEWSGHYRDTLHAAVLATCETGIRTAVNRGDAEMAIIWAQRILVVDPHADSIEYELLRAYKAGNRQAAAVEQYAHYASYVRAELGAEPTPLADI